MIQHAAWVTAIEGSIQLLTVMPLLAYTAVKIRA
jgi:hypothetical protein